MVSSELAAHIASSSFCLFFTVLIAFQVYRNPNKLRICILCYSIIALPPSILSTLHVEGTLDSRVNSLVYLVSTLFMTVAHFVVMLDVGYRLRIGEGNWKHPFVIVGIIFLGASGVLLVAQIIYLGINPDGLQQFPLKGCFVAGVVCAIIGDSSVFIYTFMPLIYWRKNRTNEGLSRITALGIWFFLVQNTWYTIYGVLYVWFFIANSWDYFPTLLGFDYLLRFIEILIYTWPPPKTIIDSMTSRLPNSANDSSGRKTSNNDSTSTPTNFMSSERYNKEENTEYNVGNACELTVRSEQPSVHSNNDYGSKVTIVTR